jgi:hypothetical protein
MAAMSEFVERLPRNYDAATDALDGDFAGCN